MLIATRIDLSRVNVCMISYSGNPIQGLFLSVIQRHHKFIMWILFRFCFVIIGVFLFYEYSLISLSLDSIAWCVGSCLMYSSVSKPCFLLQCFLLVTFFSFHALDYPDLMLYACGCGL